MKQFPNFYTRDVGPRVKDEASVVARYAPADKFEARVEDGALVIYSREGAGPAAAAATDARIVGAGPAQMRAARDADSAAIAGMNKSASEHWGRQ